MGQATEQEVMVVGLVIVAAVMAMGQVTERATGMGQATEQEVAVIQRPNRQCLATERTVGPVTE